MSAFPGVLAICGPTTTDAALSNENSNTATSDIAIVTGHASANTKGAWTQLDASTSMAADGFHLLVNNVEGAFDALLDIGIGAGGSEVVILSNVLFSAPAAIASMGEFQAYIPIPIAAGTRVAARFQDNIGSARTIRVGLTLAAGSFYADMAATTATTYGANTADSGGVEVTPDASANTKGAWAQVDASLDEDTRSLLICIGSTPASERDNGTFLFDLGVGAAAAESAVLANEWFRSNTSDDIFRPGWRTRFLNLNAGDRLTARGQSTITTVDRIFDIVVVAFD